MVRVVRNLTMELQNRYMIVIKSNLFAHFVQIIKEIAREIQIQSQVPNNLSDPKQKSFCYTCTRTHNSKLFSNLNFPPNQKTLFPKNHELFKPVLPIRTPRSTKKWNLGKSGQNKSPVFANGEGRCDSFLKILNRGHQILGGQRSL